MGERFRGEGFAWYLENTQRVILQSLNLFYTPDIIVCYRVPILHLNCIKQFNCAEYTETMLLEGIITHTHPPYQRWSPPKSSCHHHGVLVDFRKVRWGRIFGDSGNLGFNQRRGQTSEDTMNLVNNGERRIPFWNKSGPLMYQFWK